MIIGIAGRVIRIVMCSRRDPLTDADSVSASLALYIPSSSKVLKSLINRSCILSTVRTKMQSGDKQLQGCNMLTVISC